MEITLLNVAIESLGYTSDPIRRATEYAPVTTHLIATPHKGSVGSTLRSWEFHAASASPTFGIVGTGPGTPIQDTESIDMWCRPMT